MSLEVIKCPKCGSPVSGLDCRTCGFRPETATTVRCADCGDLTFEDGATEKRTQNQFGGWSVRHYCSDCG